MNKLAVIAYSGETGFNWPLELSKWGWDYIVLDTGHRTGRNHKQEMFKSRLNNKKNGRKNRFDNFRHHFHDEDIVSSVESLALEIEEKYNDLLEISRIVNSAIKNIQNPTNNTLTSIVEQNRLLADIPDEKILKVGNISNMKESAAWLQWIISNYSKLPDRIAFMQGFPFDHCSEISDTLLKNDEYFGFPENQERSIKEDEYLYKEMNYIYEKMHGKKLDSFRWSAGAQFCCSKEFVLSKPLDFYKTLFEEGKTLKQAAEVYERMYWKLIKG